VVVVVVAVVVIVRSGNYTRLSQGQFVENSKGPIKTTKKALAKKYDAIKLEDNKHSTE